MSVRDVFARRATVRGAALIALLSTSCAHVEELPDGSRRVTGLVRMVVPGAIAAERRGADSLEVSTLGLLLVRTPAGTSVSLGFSSERITALRNHAYVESFPMEDDR